jgi:UDP-N-acetylmuramate--alanine ligase
VSYVASGPEAAEAAAAAAKSGDVILTLGAGDVSRLGEHVIGHLRSGSEGRKA